MGLGKNQPCSFSYQDYQCPLHADDDSDLCLFHADEPVRPVQLSSRLKSLDHELRDLGSRTNRTSKVLLDSVNIDNPEAEMLRHLNLRNVHWIRGTFKSIQCEDALFQNHAFEDCETRDLRMIRSALDSFKISNSYQDGGYLLRSSLVDGCIESMILREGSRFSLEESSLVRVFIVKAQISHANLLNCRLERVEILDSKCTSLNLEHCDLVGCDLRGIWGSLYFKECRIFDCKIPEPSEFLTLSLIDCERE
ncbi:hypothetical protein HOF92_16655 [bacterium]|jgi:uncharacterized protein YjbI with pentapeptide repeats|nr:hypothetical protein [bacterium]